MMKLSEDLYSLDGNLIAGKNQAITPYLINFLRRQKIPGKEMRSIKGTSLLNDIKESFRDERYSLILRDRGLNRKVVDLIKEIKLEKEVLRELKKMKMYFNYTYRHELIVSILAARLSLTLKRYRLNPKTAVFAAITHDVGKTRIPVNILRKKTPLTKGQYDILKTHPVIGYVLLSYCCSQSNYIPARVAYQHHEKLNGKGYPNGIKNIGIYSQVVDVIDILDALLSKRPYREKSYNLREALDTLIISAGRGELNRNIVFELIKYARGLKSKRQPIFISRKMRHRPPAGVYGKIKK